MIITRKSPFTGNINTMDIPVTQQQIAHWNTGVLIQDALPNFSADEREFIMTGITAKEWDDMFPPRDEDLERDEYWAAQDKEAF